MHTPSRRLSVAGLALLLAALSPPPETVRAAEVATSAVRNLGTPTRPDLPSLDVVVSRVALSLGGLQVGEWTDTGADLVLGDIEGIRSPCRDLDVDGWAQTLTAVCPDDHRNERLVLAQPGAVLRFEHELVPEAEPAISDDGARIAVVVREDGVDILRILDLQQTLELGVVGLEEPRHPVLAGTGSAVACTALVDGERHAVVVDLEAGRAQVLSSGQKDVRVAAISANGRRILFRGVGRPGDVLYLADLDRGTRHALSNGKGVPAAADLAQHGDTAAFLERLGGAVGLFSVDMSARKVVNLAGFFEPARDVIVSASGERIAFVTSGPSPHVEVLDVEGRSVRSVIQLAEGCADPTLSSDGRYVAALCAARGREATVVSFFPLPTDDE